MNWAPSGHNSQPWEIIVVDDKKKIEELMTVSSQIFYEFQQTRRDIKKIVTAWWRWRRWSDEELEAKGDGMYSSPAMVRASCI